MEYKTLKDIAKITMGQSPDSSSYNNEKDGLPFFQGNADFGELYPNERFWCNAPKKVAMPGDILISVRAPIGALNYAKGKSCIGRGLAAITIENIVERNYIFHLLKARNNYLNSMGTGSTFKAIGKNVLEEILIPQISREEQQKCVNMMDLLGSIIRERQSQLGKFDEIIKARFVEMFGDIIINDRLWKTDSWSNLLKIVNGKNQKSVESNNGKYVICGSGGIIGRATDYLTKENSVIIGRKGNINKPILMREKYWNVDTAFGVEPNENYICVEYLYMFCLFFDFNRLNKAVTIPSLTKMDLLNISMPIPDLHTQKRFATFVSQVNKSKVVSQHTTSNPYIQNLNFAVKWL